MQRNMKTYAKVWALALPFMMMASCRPDQPTDPGTAMVAGQGVAGTWVQSGATVYDITLPVPETQDLTKFYTKTGNGWTITFNNDGSYVVDQAGKGPNPFGASGEWSFDTAYYPTNMNIMATGDSVSTDIKMLNAPRENDIYFGVSFEVEKCNTPVSRYEFIFTRQQ